MSSASAPLRASAAFGRLARQRSVRITAVIWVAANFVVLLAAGDELPFDWPAVAGSSVDHLVNTNIGMLGIFGLMALTCLLTRHRVRPYRAASASDLTTMRRETLLVLAYGALGLVVGFFLARLFGWHPFGLHLAGSIFGTHDHVAPVEAIAWAGYNFVVYVVVPLVYFRRRYSAEQLNLVSSDPRNDACVIAVVLLIESVVQFATLSTAIGRFTAGQYLIGMPLTFVLYLAGAVFPAMIFIYCILVPRFLELTGSIATTVVLGGVTYTLLHLWDAWTVLTSPANSLLSIIFLFFTYFGPGMMKTVLTVRTGNAWTHVWAYHAVAPHVLIDAPHVVGIFRVR